MYAVVSSPLGFYQLPKLSKQKRMNFVDILNIFGCRHYLLYSRNRFRFSLQFLFAFILDHFCRFLFCTCLFLFSCCYCFSCCCCYWCWCWSSGRFCYCCSVYVVVWVKLYLLSLIIWSGLVPSCSSLYPSSLLSQNRSQSNSA